MTKAEQYQALEEARLAAIALDSLELKLSLPVAERAPTQGGAGIDPKAGSRPQSPRCRSSANSLNVSLTPGSTS